MLRTLDTNICSYILRRHPAEMVERFSALSLDHLWLSAIVVAELRYGAVKFGSARFSATVEAWLVGFEMRPWSLEATHQYAKIRTELERKGKPIGSMDLMIAAHALAEDTIVVTNNAREFHRVPGLAMEEWSLS